MISQSLLTHGAGLGPYGTGLGMPLYTPCSLPRLLPPPPPPAAPPPQQPPSAAQLQMSAVSLMTDDSKMMISEQRIQQDNSIVQKLHSM